MPKLTYKAQTPDDPQSVKVGNQTFEAGKAVDVSDETAERLKDNPWFSGGKDARKRAEEAAAPGGSTLVDSSVNLSPPPGTGMKTDPGGVVSTGEGLVPAEQADLTDGANTLDDESEEPKARRGRGKA